MGRENFENMRGIIPIIQTPFTADGMDVDYEDFGRMCDATIKDGSTGIALFGYGTEFYKLSDEECEKMVSTAVAAAKGRVPIITSITAGSTEVAVKRARKYAELGADAIMVLSPSVIPPATNKLRDHIITVLNSVDLPGVIQYTPGVGGGKLNAEAIRQILDSVKNKLYIKAEAIPVAPFIDSVRELTGGKVGIFSGNMCLHMIDLMDRGTIGFMPGTSLVPIFKDIFDSYMSGDKERAKRIYDAVVPMVLGINQDIEILVKYEKRMMIKRGIIKCDYCRKPTDIPFDEQLWESFVAYRESLKDITNIGEYYQP